MKPGVAIVAEYGISTDWLVPLNVNASPTIPASKEASLASTPELLPTLSEASSSACHQLTSPEPSRTQAGPFSSDSSRLLLCPAAKAVMRAAGESWFWSRTVVTICRALVETVRMATPAAVGEPLAVVVARVPAGGAAAACNTWFVSRMLLAACTALLAARRTAASAADGPMAAVLAALWEAAWITCTGELNQTSRQQTKALE